ncbi:hypothetical protein [Pedobacter ureilyticus]|uniref:Uncharacterized protein n=1 Tax=Pedobacter ureilyticus TaxID=1393051 RepID=A0ABW9J9B4_9SPHI|nr:hypothetical protein [Pedobacter helvus]
METFQINVVIDEMPQEYEVRSIGNDIANKRYELFRTGTRQAEVWLEATDEGLNWHTEDVMDEATLKKIGKAIEMHEL